LSLNNLSFVNSSNNLFSGLILGLAGDGKYELIILGEGNVNNTFTNATYNFQNETVSNGSLLQRNWFYRLYVNDSAGNAKSANVTITNVSGGVTNLTTSLGYTPLIALSYYINGNGTRYFNSFYNINATNSSSSANHTYNLTSNNYLDVLTFYFVVTEEVEEEDIVSTSASSTLDSTEEDSEVTSPITSYDNETYLIQESDLEGGYRSWLDTLDRILFNYSQDEYVLFVELFNYDESNSNISLILYPQEIKFSLNLSESFKIDLDSDGYYDLLIGFDGINEWDTAEVLIQKINESIVKNAAVIDSNMQESEKDLDESKGSFIAKLWEKSKKPLFLSITFLHILLAAIIVFLIILISLVVSNLYSQLKGHKIADSEGVKVIKGGINNAQKIESKKSEKVQSKDKDEAKN
jgi:hypothetical protein